MRRLLVAFSLFALWPACMYGQAAPAPPAPPATAAPPQSAEQNAAQTQGPYPNSRAGLQQFLEDLFTAIRSNDQAKVNQMWQTTVMPDHAKWFATTFGAQEGAALDARYVTQLAATTSGPGKAYTFVSGLDNFNIQVLLLVQAAATRPESLAKAISLSTKADVDAYKAEAIVPGGTSSVMLGYFFYVAGSFRVVDELVFLSLSAARASIRLPYISAFDAQMMLLQSVPPSRPAQRIPPTISRTVVLEVIIDVAGQVQSASIVSGNFVFGEAARAAVLRWRYRPYLQNGRAVPVETTVSITFPY